METGIPSTKTAEGEHQGRLQALRYSKTNTVEGDQRRLQTAYLKTLEMVQQLEKELDIQETWKEGDANWVRVGGMANTLQYRRSLDKVAQLVVARMFELGRVNTSGPVKTCHAESCGNGDGM